MPSRSQHLGRAERNEKLGSAFRREPGYSADWAITILFYSALHYVDAFLAGKNYHPLDHDSRDTEIERNGSIADIYKVYRRLKDWSRSARYNIANYPPEQVEKARDQLLVIKDHVLTRIG